MEKISNKTAQENLEKIKKILAGEETEVDLPSVAEEDEVDEKEVGEEKTKRWSGKDEDAVDGKSGGTWHDNHDNY